MLFTFIVAVFKCITDKWNAYVITVHEHMKNKEICNDAMERAKAIEMKNAEQRVRDDRAREICELIDQSEMVKSLWTRVVMLENCVQQHENRVRQLETQKALLEKLICLSCVLCCMIICFHCP
jgi:putative protein kinase ArgK-like GTPase of G3E family